jgi:trans-2,3-dihydro-3-hydroxyanthranilate isomerase
MNRFYIVDVFAERRYGGNQLAVFLLDEPLSATEMQAMAREIGFSESTFVTPVSGEDGSFAVRIFTPAREIPFAGHPSLGTAHVIRTSGLADAETVVLAMEAGKIPVRRDPAAGDILWMAHPQPGFGDTLPKAKLAVVLGLSQDDIAAEWPAEEVSTGLGHIVVPLVSLDALRRAKVDRAAYFDLIETTRAKNLLVFAPEPHEHGNDLSIRMFADYLGIAEDPATGSGNGCLLAYLARHKYWGNSNIAVRSEQGYEIGRPSLLHGKAEIRDQRYTILVGGRVMPVAQGIWG